MLILGILVSLHTMVSHGLTQSRKLTYYAHAHIRKHAQAIRCERQILGHQNVSPSHLVQANSICIQSARPVAINKLGS